MKNKTEAMLCNAFMELLRKYPFPKITIQKIAAQCGVNRQTFYYYFDNIFDLMTKTFAYELVDKRKILEEESLEFFLKRFLSWMKENRSIIKNILSNVESKYLRRAIYPLICEEVRGIFCPGKDAGSLEDYEENGRAKEEFAIHFLIIGITQYILEWADSDFKESVDEVVDNLCLIQEKLCA